MNLAKEIEIDEELAKDTNRERMKVNFDFWRTRARAEQTDECLDARKAIHDGDRAFAKGDLIRARPEYEKGLRGWRKVLDDPEFHALVDDVSLGGDLIDVIRRYQKCLDQDDQDLPHPFILQDIIDKHGNRPGTMPLDIRAKKAKSPPATAEKPDKKGTPASTSGPNRSKQFEPPGLSTHPSGRTLAIQNASTQSPLPAAIHALLLVCYQKVPGSRYSRVLADAMDRVARRFYQPVDELNLFEGAMSGMIEAARRRALEIHQGRQETGVRGRPQPGVRGHWNPPGHRSQDEAVPRAQFRCPAAPPSRRASVAATASSRSTARARRACR